MVLQGKTSAYWATENLRSVEPSFFTSRFRNHFRQNMKKYMKICNSKIQILSGISYYLFNVAVCVVVTWLKICRVTRSKIHWQTIFYYSYSVLELVSMAELEDLLLHQ